ncbi:TetR/AcrR family transcriptional regulator [Streptomyces sp. NPDC018833]|uniref:TetR/AcrR family transcriptional regulator n=1 Tax=Streptomyces sp. NPDC018833 TaxID=3365053 RepID=UPI0037A7B8D8
MGDVKRVGRQTLKARETRRRILEAARALFVERGYGVTTLQDIAAEAGVAVQTIYFVFGNKRTLLKELVDISIAGDDEPEATMDRPWFVNALAAETADAQLQAHISGTREILERVAPMMKVIDTAAAMDPEIAELWRQDEDPRFTVQATAAKALMAKEGAREGLPVERAADVLFGLLSPELYLLFVHERGWSPEQWQRWAYDTLRLQLCST